MQTKSTYKKTSLLSLSVMEDKESEFRQEHQMQHMILIISQIKKEKHYKEHDVMVSKL